MTASLQGRVATAVQLAYSVAVVLTFPLQAFPALQVTCGALGCPTAGTQRSVVASSLEVLLGVIAYVARDALGDVVSILGSLFGIPLALVFPPIMNNLLVKDNPTYRQWMNYGVVVLGFGAMAAASTATIVSWDKGTD